MCVPLMANLRAEGGVSHGLHERDRGKKDVLPVGIAGWTRGKLDEESRLAHVGGHAFELERLEACPAEEGGVMGGEAAEELGDVFVRIVGADRLLLDGGHLGHGVLADLFVGRPVLSLALGGLERERVSVPMTQQRIKIYSRNNWSPSA